MKPLSPSEIETIRVAEPKHDPFSLEALVAWLERRDPAIEYCPTEPGICLLGQFSYAMRATDPFEKSMQLSRDRAAPFERIAYAFVQGDPEEYTFGAALTRASPHLRRSPRPSLHHQGGGTVSRTIRAFIHECDDKGRRTKPAQRVFAHLAINSTPPVLAISLPDKRTTRHREVNITVAELLRALKEAGVQP